jgi:hypothetical protein
VVAAARETESIGAPLTDTVLAARLSEHWAEEILATAVSILKNGGRIEGYGLNKPKSVRAWAPGMEETVARRVAAQDGGWKELGISPAQLSKKFPDLYDELKEHVVQVQYEAKSLKEVKTKKETEDETIRLLQSLT